jgi:hypothetical protein
MCGLVIERTSSVVYQCFGHNVMNIDIEKYSDVQKCLNKSYSNITFEHGECFR